MDIDKDLKEKFEAIPIEWSLWEKYSQSPNLDPDDGSKNIIWRLMKMIESRDKKIESLEDMIYTTKDNLNLYWCVKCHHLYLPGYVCFNCYHDHTPE